MVQNPTPKELFLAFWNFNWGTSQSKDQKLVDHIFKTYPDIEMVAGVETKVDNFHQMFPKTFRVVQNLHNQASQNVAVAWLKGHLTNPKVRGLKKGTDNKGAKMLPRPLRIVDFDLQRRRVIKNQKIRLIVAHRPPQRFKFLDKFFDASVKFRINCRKWSRRGFWVLAMDYNENGHDVAKKFGGTFYGSGIDGFICGPCVEVHDLVVDDLPRQKKWTDHVGVVGHVRLR